jgi:uncharacterized Zn finger protein
MEQSMRAVQEAEKKRQLDGVDSRFTDLVKMNDLQRACLDSFPHYPTMLPSVGVLNSAFDSIKKQACQSLNAGSANQVKIDPNIMQQIQNQATTQVAQQAPSQSIGSSVMNALKSLFQ